MVRRPNNVQAEYAINKMLLVQPECAEEVFAILTQNDFYNEHNSVVFHTLNQMQLDGVALDEVTLRGYLNSSYEAIGGELYFEKLSQVEAFLANLPDYLKSIKDTSILRNLIDAGLDIAEHSMHAVKPESGVAKLNHYADLITNDLSSDSSVVSIESLVKAQKERLEQRIQNPGFKGTKTGILDYDMYIGGLEPTNLIYVAARPSAGKTSLLLSMLASIALSGEPGVIFSYEMTAEQIFDRLVSIFSGVTYTKIRTGRLDDLSRAKVMSAFGIVASLPIYLLYSPSMRIDEVVNTTTKLVKQKGIKVAMLDYIQLLSSKTGNQNDELGYISRQLKINALNNDIVWLAASQLNRSVEMRENKRPILADLRESGNLEQDADVVVMIYRDCMYNPSINNENLAELLVRKNRHGPTADLLIKFDKKVMKFESLEQ